MTARDGSLITPGQPPADLHAAGAWHAAGRPHLLLVALGTALFASVVPYSLELAALRRAPRRVFGIPLSLEPAVATLAGWLLLAQRTTPVMLAAVTVVICASTGSALGAGTGGTGSAGAQAAAP